MQEQLLRTQILSGREGAMGDTSAGANWCIKALHPSDPLTQVRGIPDMSATTSLCMNYQTTFTLSPQAGATGTWEFDATLLPHPVNFMVIDYKTSVAESSECVLNSQLSGTTHQDKVNWLIANAQQWRLVYAGVTITQDGPDLANQGTVVVSQSAVVPYTYPASASLGTGVPVGCVFPIQVYTSEDRPSYTASQAMPNAYFDASKKGVYIPLKLTKTCQQWRSQADLVGSGSPGRLTPNNTYAVFTSENYAWPHYDLPCTWAGSPPTVTTTAKAVPDVGWHHYYTSPMLNDVMAHISARNCAVTTSFAFFFRYGIEMRVHPASTLSPQLELAPRYDDRALVTYFSVSRELKDAYEAKFNDLGKLWGVISTVAKDVLPVVGALGPAGRAVSIAGKGVLGAGDAIRQARQQRKAAKVWRQAQNAPPPLPPKPAATTTTTTTAIPAAPRRRRRNRNK